MHGLALLTRSREKARPHHALAMAAPRAARRLDLDEEQARAALAGHTLPSPGENGYVLLTTGGLPLGWGKRVDGVIKNHIPKSHIRKPLRIFSAFLLSFSAML